MTAPDGAVQALDSSLGSPSATRPLSYQQQDAELFLEALGKSPDSSWVRYIHPQRGGGGADQHGLHPLKTAHKVASGINAYVVIGEAETATGKAGGVTDADVIGCPALFVEWDDGAPVAEQSQRWETLGLPEPTITVATGGKSVHCYWTLTEPMAPSEWKPLQAALIAHCNSDPQCKNPSRVMRLPGSIYYDKRSGQARGHCTILNATGTRYDSTAISAAIKPKPAKAKPPAQQLQLPPRSLDQIKAAAEYIPARIGGEGTYEQDRNALCGCAAALAEAGHPEHLAIELLGHKWPSRDEAEQVLGSTTTREAASFWSIAREHGYSLQRGSSPFVRADGAAAPSAAATSQKPSSNKGGATRVQPAQVLAWLPDRIGTPRLNTRSGDITARDGVLGRNAIGRLYLQLSDDQWSWPKEATADAVIHLAEQHSYDPVAHYLQNNTAEPLPMEQWERLDLHMLGLTDGDEIAAAFLPRFLISAVARTFQPGCDVRQSPVLVGPQWIGKSALGRILFGADQWVAGVGDLGKDALERLHTAWGCELAELDGITRKADQESLKAFLTEVCDTYRKPYDRAPERHPRRFVFWGSSNGAALRDATGSTRFVCIPVERTIPLGWTEANRDAIWARAVEQYRAGIQWWECSSAERKAIAERNENYEETDPWLEVLEPVLRINPNGFITIGELLDKLEVPTDRRNNTTSGRVRKLAERLGWEYERRQYRGERLRGLWRKDYTSDDDTEF